MQAPGSAVPESLPRKRPRTDGAANESERGTHLQRRAKVDLANERIPAMGAPVKIRYSSFCTSLQRMVVAAENDPIQSADWKLKVTTYLQETIKLMQEAHAKEMAGLTLPKRRAG